MKQLPNITVRPPTVIFTVMLLLIDRSILSFIPLAAAILHECGHLAAMAIFGIPVNEIEFTLFGMEIRTPPITLGLYKKITVFVAGAAVNLMSAAFVYFAESASFELRFFGACSLILAILNLLPIGTLDGGSVMRELLIHTVPRHTYDIMRIISAVTLFLLWLAAAYILLICGGNLSLMLFCIYLFAELFLR